MGPGIKGPTTTSSEITLKAIELLGPLDRAWATSTNTAAELDRALKPVMCFSRTTNFKDRLVVLARCGHWDRKSVVALVDAPSKIGTSTRHGIYPSSFNIISRGFRRASRYERPAVATLANGPIPRLTEMLRGQTEVSTATHDHTNHHAQE
eukprot:6192955-Pleurochrysis_carterae.AAC.1